MEDELEKLKKASSYIIYRGKKENIMLPVDQVLFFKAQRILVEIHILDGRTELVEKPLNQLETMLPDYFIRIHRSFIVNLHHVVSYKYIKGGSYELLLKNEEVLPVSKYRIKTLKTHFIQ